VGEWESERVREWESGRVGEWESGRVSERVGEWESGRVGEWETRREAEIFTTGVLESDVKLIKIKKDLVKGACVGKSGF
jgi:hypothetical protein